MSSATARPCTPVELAVAGSRRCASSTASESWLQCQALMRECKDGHSQVRGLRKHREARTDTLCVRSLLARIFRTPGQRSALQLTDQCLRRPMASRHGHHAAHVLGPYPARAVAAERCGRELASVCQLGVHWLRRRNLFSVFFPPGLYRCAQVLC